MIHSATRASARAACRRGAASAGAISSRHHQRVATAADANSSLCRSRGVASAALRTPRHLGVMERMIPPPSRRGFASAVATFEEGGAGGLAPGAPAAAEAGTVQKEDGPQQPQAADETKPKPRRRRLLRDRPAPITLTDRAAAHLISLVEAKPGKVGVRLGVKRRGCNGMSYTLKYAEEKPKGDEEVIVQAVPSSATTAPGGTPASPSSGGGGGRGSDVRLFVDPMATLYIAGTVMDWEETELSSEFTFTNPNAKGECGCGESFNV